MAIYVALGSNLGNRQANLAMALRMLEPLARVEAVSALYESPPQPPAPPPAYLNAACRIVTGLSPDSLLRHLKRIEHSIGRRDTQRWAPRPIDLDIALYHDQVIADGDLTVPHPRLTERAFVLRPLLDLDPELSHPASGARLTDVLTRLGSDGLVQVAAAGWHETGAATR
ncbi:MAG TPA: 2-amino-4-hydroxy-6-hydroxymethyldihydropteridine diphosphokinase [Dehalococcoidia bacterium]|nr:2-amino-4-hydroxy-6-hydroxymethyldihydropteridine diphosphokinase [Dehalococcoidia bacterium]